MRLALLHHPLHHLRPSQEIYFNRANTPCADWLAWANIAVAACEMICERAMLVVSDA